MTAEPNSERSVAIRSAIQEFLQMRLDTKLAEADSDRLLASADRDLRKSALRNQFAPAAWLAHAALRAKGIQLATHTIKGIHPRARGSSLMAKPSLMAQIEEVGTHVLGETFTHDAAANAADLDVLALLKLPLGNSTFLDCCLTRNPDLAAALDDEGVTALALMERFSIVATQGSRLSTHAFAKQVYWFVGNDPSDDSQYHLLAPLFPSSLTHRIYNTLQFDLYSEQSKLSRAAQRQGAMHPNATRRYSALVKQALGGLTRKAQNNVSDLNGVRQGTNYLLASLPPVWQSRSVQPVFGVESLFDVFKSRPDVRELVAQLRRFLESDPTPNLKTRDRRDALVDAILDDLIQFAAELHELDPGWTADPRCELPRAHIAWLYPLGGEALSSDMMDTLAGDFANWLNAQLRAPLPMGDPEHLNWKQRSTDLFREMEREGAYELA